MKKNCLVFILNIYLLFPNDTLKGYIFDAATKEPLSYVQIGILQKKCGTVSDEKGYFQLIVPDKLTASDTVVFQMLSYVTLKKSFGNNPSPVKIHLEKAVTNLQEVEIVPKNAKKIVLGNHRYNKNTSCFFSVSNPLQGTKKSGEGAIKANNKKNREVWMERFNFFIIKNPMTDTLVFRLNFYIPDPSGYPGLIINKTPVIFKVPPQKKGLVSVDLKNYSLHVTGDFFISIEVLTDFTDATQPAFSCALLGTSYYRGNAFSDWEKFPVGGLDFNVDCVYFK